MYEVITFEISQIDSLLLLTGESKIKTSLTGESRFHISPPREFEPVTLVAGSK
jgi:hypothetical protein